MHPTLLTRLRAVAALVTTATCHRSSAWFVRAVAARDRKTTNGNDRHQPSITARANERMRPGASRQRASACWLLAATSLGLALPATEAATTLAKGDLVILAFNGDGSNASGTITYDGLSMMPLVNLEAGTVIYVTDIGWSDLTKSFLNYAGIADKIVKYTAPTAIAAGTIIRCDVDHQTGFTLEVARTPGDTLPYFNNISTLNSAEEILVFQGSVATPKFIFAVTDVVAGWASSVPANGTDGSGHGSALPQDLGNDTTALSLASGTTPIDNWAYTGPTTPATKVDWQSRVADQKNWTGDDENRTVLTGAYSVTDAPLPALSLNDIAASEGNSGTTTFTFTVALSMPAPAGGVTFDIATANGTATAGSDYVAKSLTGQTIPTGATTSTFDVTVNGDATLEPNETFSVNVTNLAGATISDASGLGTITNDDVAPPTYSTWAAAAFSATDLLNPAISGANADPDGAGLTNLMRYALDLSPRGPVSSPASVTITATTPATVAVPIRAVASDIRYEVQSSTDLVAWTTVATYTANGTKRTEIATVAVPTGAARYFLRLAIVAN